VLARPLFRWSALPDSRILDAATAAERDQWARGCLRRLGIANRYCLALGGDYVGLPWSVVEVPDDCGWFPALWLRAGMPDALVLSTDQTRLLYLSEESGDWFEYLRPVVSLLPEAWAQRGDERVAHCSVGRPLFYGDSEWRRF
jgi:hypothetical protein